MHQHQWLTLATGEIMDTNVIQARLMPLDWYPHRCQQRPFGGGKRGRYLDMFCRKRSGHDMRLLAGGRW
jgi:hypothetical protein